MPIYELKVLCTGSILETWRIEASNPEEARYLFETAEDGQTAEFISDHSEGDREEDREIIDVAPYEPSAISNVEYCREAELLLRHARDLLKAAGAERTLERVRLAITSCGGAVRHATTEPYRLERQAAKGGRKS